MNEREIMEGAVTAAVNAAVAEVRAMYSRRAQEMDRAGANVQSKLRDRDREVQELSEEQDRVEKAFNELRAEHAAEVSHLQDEIDDLTQALSTTGWTIMRLPNGLILTPPGDRAWVDEKEVD